LVKVYKLDSMLIYILLYALYSFHNYFFPTVSKYLLKTGVLKPIPKEGRF